MANPAPVREFMPVGFRFRPTDEELVDHYLTNKLIGENFVHHIIAEIDVCKHEPWDLPAFSMIQSDDPEWFFFSPRDYKYSKSNSTRYNRTTQRGFWKPTGNDRKIKVRGTNEIIGTKKTLVFYRGRAPNAFKTNWVIHEYQAETDHSSFVLCKLMKKPEKAEGRTGLLICDEGEPSSHMASDCEILAIEGRIPDEHPLPSINLDSFFDTQHPADEVDLSSIRFSPVNEWEFSFPPFSPRLNSHIGNDDSSVNFPFETTEEEDNPVKFVNSVFVDDEEEDNPDMFVNSIFADDEEEMFVDEAMNHAFVQCSKSLRKVYYESSDTDAEVVSSQYGYIPETSTKSNKNAGPSSSGRILTISELSSNQAKKGRSFQDDLDSSSGDSTAARPLKINLTKLDSSASTLKTCKAQYQPRSAHSVSLRAGARRSQTHRKISTKEAYYEAQKETPDDSNNKKREAQVSDKRNTSKAPSGESSGISGKSSLIQLETPSSNQNLSPPSVYFGNVVIGLVLFVVVIWEMLSCGKF